MANNRENRLAYMASNRENLENHPIYSFDIDMGSSMIFNEARPQKDELGASDNGSCESDYQSVEADLKDGFDGVSPVEGSDEGWWQMSFDGTTSKQGAGAGIWIRHHVGEPKLLSYKLHFKCTNNTAKYEALVLGLKALKDLQAQRIDIQGDSKLIIKQVQGSYQAKHPRLRSYRNLVLDLMEGFKECQFIVIPRRENSEVDALAVSASMFQVPRNPKEHYQIEVKHRPSIPDNVDHW